MNVSDSELVASILQDAGYLQADSIDSTDILIFNTCSVREHAEQRVLGRISNEIARKQLKPGLLIGVMGCMAQRLGQKLLTMNRRVDFVIGVDNYRFLPNIIKDVSDKQRQTNLSKLSETELYDEIMPVRKEKHNAFITIMRGCDNFCSYCIVPYVRGRERSRPAESIISEVTAAAEKGFKEITLLGQNVNSYNYQGISFPQLLIKANKVEGIMRIRFVTSHPKDLTDSLITAMAECDKVCEHIHLPLQSGDNDILRKMNRRYTVEQYLSKIANLRRKIPGIAITTDLMTGFPGETEKQFLNTVKALETIRFDFAYMFKYSVRSGTKAAKFSDDIEETVKLARLEQIIKLQNKITFEKYLNKVGGIEEVLVEKTSKKSSSELAGKTRDFKIVVFPSTKDLIGKAVKTKIISAAGWTLRGELI